MISINLTIIVQIVSFLILVFVLKHILFKPVLKILDDREATTDSSIKKAQEILRETEQTEKLYSKHVHESKVKALELQNRIEFEASRKARELIDQKQGEVDKKFAIKREKITGIFEKEKETLPSLSRDISQIMVDRILG